MKKFLGLVVLLAASCLAVFLWGEYRLQQERDSADRRLELASRIAKERQDEITRLQAELDRLEAWGYLVTFQEDLHAIDLEIQGLNYGNALEKLDALEEKIQEGELGGLLAGASDDLADEFEALREELRTMGGDATGRLRLLGSATFDTLSGFAVEQMPVAGDANDESLPDIEEDRGDETRGPEEETGALEGGTPDEDPTAGEGEGGADQQTRKPARRLQETPPLVPRDPPRAMRAR